ncbi:ribose-phosphate diphosphokinase [Leisingera methylohalidivorans]|uniref:Phosphoribosylpyrophosphate synthetase n=1 Tax=Leisingera methylohalidivorans DSM 14336 TaxID=999552 RepID=V9W0I3_9RHOB|nr:ribose-phosphate diphosphokinase [Leisingera methylohalidivorans]AHD03658.1 phosphoribosylpyrophosphate synthetase [Leisingera methylohalidivorans DSM 14336]
MKPVLAPFPDMQPMAARLAPVLGTRIVPVAWRHFPDGESLITLSGDVADCDLAILCTLRDPDRHMLPLRFAAATARELGANSIGLIAPYLGYMRQDQRFAAGQAVSAPLFAACLEESFDWLVTADPHLHRIPDLAALFTIPARRAVTAPALAGWITRNIPDPVLIGPDEESRQWVAQVAALASCPCEVLRKHRSGDREVEVSVPSVAALKTGTAVILDDIASSGRTLVKTIERLAPGNPPVCVVIHAVFAAGAHAGILAAGARRIVTTDSIPHESNAISIAQILAEAVCSLP